MDQARQQHQPLFYVKLKTRLYKPLVSETVDNR